jgi:hypothetical protein
VSTFQCGVCRTAHPMDLLGRPCPSSTSPVCGENNPSDDPRGDGLMLRPCIREQGHLHMHRDRYGQVWRTEGTADRDRGAGVRLRVTAELDNGFRQVAQFDHAMEAGDAVLVEVLDGEHIAVTMSDHRKERADGAEAEWGGQTREVDLPGETQAADGAP